MEIDKKNGNKERLLQLPSNDKSINEWQKWGERLIKRYIDLKTTDQERIKKIRAIKKDLQKKNKVMGYWKKRALELEEENEILSHSFGIWIKDKTESFLKFIKSRFN